MKRALIALALLSIVICCVQKGIRYEVSKCSAPRYEFRNTFIYDGRNLTAYVWTNCCGTEIEVKGDGENLTIYEIKVGEICKCMCEREVKVFNIPKPSRVLFVDWCGKRWVLDEIIEERGVVKYIPLEGGFYGIIGCGGRYIPLNLPEEFKKDGMKVIFKARLKDVVTIYMWGKPVEIIEIKRLHE